tara:strand:- start:265 stop:741 length:477 start_codon:yes stop_codon:yes gene_type:complete
MPQSQKKRGGKLGISWEKKLRPSPVRKSLRPQKKLIFKRLYEDKIGIPSLREELAEIGLTVSENTLRAFVYETFEDEFGRPSSLKKKKSPQMQELDDVKPDLLEALYETDVTYSDIRRGLETAKIKVTLGTLLKFIRNEIYSVRPPPKRFRKSEDKRK